MRQVRPPPDDPRIASAVARLQKSLGELAPRIETGDAPAVSQALNPILKEARQLNYGRLLGEALALLGRAEAHQPQHYAAAARAYQEAFEHSFVAHDDDVAAEAAVQLVCLADEISAPGAHEAWTEIATTLLTRLGGHDFSGRGWRKTAASSSTRRAGSTRRSRRLREALRRKRAVLPPSHPDIETSLVSLAGDLKNWATTARRWTPSAKQRAS